MKDIAEGQVRLQQMLVVTEGLIAYMKPTPEQVVLLRCTLAVIAGTAVQMSELLKED